MRRKTSCSAVTCRISFGTHAMHIKAFKPHQNVGQMAVGQARFEANNFKKLSLLWVFDVLTL